MSQHVWGVHSLEPLVHSSWKNIPASLFIGDLHQLASKECFRTRSYQIKIKLGWVRLAVVYKPLKPSNPFWMRFTGLVLSKYMAKQAKNKSVRRSRFLTSFVLFLKNDRQSAVQPANLAPRC